LQELPLSKTSTPGVRTDVPALATDSLAALYAVHAEEIAFLRNTIDELLLLAHRQEQEKQQLLDSVAKQLPRLREANEHLVLSAFGAQDLLAQAEHANRQQSEFMSMLAHELRTPLQPVAIANGMIGLLGDMHPDLPRLSGVIQRQVRYMARLVDDLLDIGRIRSGKMTVEPTHTTLAEIVDSALETTRPLFDQRGQSVHVALPPAPVVMMGDVVRLIQAFTNLLVNASKFTQDGGAVTISAELRGTMADVHVADNGAGIEPALQAHIFDLFAQGGTPQDASRNGLGIGLALVRAIAEIHGGAVRVESAGAGQGSCFTVSLPFIAGPPG
jgi:two-component system, sensor histidine kinase